MPRGRRLDAPGVLHHIMIRGIERRTIFRDDTDREDFLARLARHLVATQTACYAWALLPNHAHLLLRTGTRPLATLMRRVLTGYAVRFNRRHKRRGVLFQNRYKSVVCQEEPYLLELVRYIHLNPLRARIVASMPELNRYPYCGQSALLGKFLRPWQATATVLQYFGQKKGRARAAYAAFVSAGIPQGRRPDLVGGGLMRSLGGWAAVTQHRGRRETPVMGDERILGDTDFVEAILAQANEQFTRQYALQRQGVDFARVVARVAELCRMEPQEVMAKGRQPRKVTARSLLCFWAVRELDLPLTTLARRLHLSPSGIGYAVQRGEAIARANQYELVK
ncbi:MAG: transposase [candidate division NC10 bacterium]|nr:transposase [candidate division NC10 bacterium]